MTDLEGLPADVRYSRWVLKRAREFGCRPSQIEDEGIELIGHLEREQLVSEALKRYR